MDTLKNKKRQSAPKDRKHRRRSSRQTRSAGAAGTASYANVVASRPSTAERQDIAVQNNPECAASRLFSDDGWNPHADLTSLALPAPASAGLARHTVSVPDADDDAFISSLFDDVLNDAEHFIPGMGVPAPHVDERSPFVESDDGMLRAFDVDNVSYVGSPDVREVVRKYSPRQKQVLDSNGVVQMINATMAQSSITIEDIEHAKEAMAKMLRSFDLGAGDATPIAPGKKTTAPPSAKQMPAKIKSNVTFNASRGLKSPRESPGLPAFPCLSLPKHVTSLQSPTTLDTLTHHRTSTSQSNDDWLETLFTTSPASPTSLCDVKLLVSPGDDALGLLCLPNDLSI